VERKKRRANTQKQRKKRVKECRHRTWNFSSFTGCCNRLSGKCKGLSCHPSYHDEQLSWDAEKESDKPTPINVKTKQTLQKTDKHH
jgi:hypothetical protein